LRQENKRANHEERDEENVQSSHCNASPVPEKELAHV